MHYLRSYDYGRMIRSRSMRHCTFVAFLLLILCIAATRSGAANSPVYPGGMQADARLVSGVFPGSDAGSCCWMLRHAALILEPPADANALIVTLFIPTYSLPPGQTQTLKAQLGSSRAQTFCCLGPGIHELALALPAARTANLTLSFDLSRSFVPAAVGQGSDRRHLTVLLRQIEWRNTLSPGLSSTLAPRAMKALLGLYAVFFVLAVFLTYRRPIFGAALLIVTSPFALYVPLGATNLTLPKTMLIAIGLALAFRGARTALSGDRRVGALLLAQGILALVALISLHNAMFAAPVWREFLKTCQYGLTGLVAYVAFRADHSQDREWWIRVSVLAITAVVALAALVQLPSGAPMGINLAGHFLPRIAGPLEGPNQLCAFLGIGLPFALAFALSGSMRMVSYAVLTLGSVAALLTFSRGGILAIVIALVLVIVSVRSSRFTRVAYRAVAILFVLLFAIAVLEFAGRGEPAFARLAFGAPSGTENFNGGLGTRAELWHGAYVLWRSHPLLGIGAGNYELQIAQTGAPGVRTHANSAYFQTLAEEGIIGLVALAGLALVSIRVFAGPNACALTPPMLAVVAALWVHQITDYVTFYPKVGVLLWAMMGLTIASLRSFSDR